MLLKMILSLFFFFFLTLLLFLLGCTFEKSLNLTFMVLIRKGGVFFFFFYQMGGVEVLKVLKSIALWQVCTKF